MSSAQDLLGSIRSSLESGTLSLAHLGAGPAEVLNLDNPGGLERYSAILRPQIELALRRNGRKQAYLTVLLTRPACTPVNASMAASRLATHDSGSGWLAMPFLYCMTPSFTTPRRFYPGALSKLL